MRWFSGLIGLCLVLAACGCSVAEQVQPLVVSPSTRQAAVEYLEARQGMEDPLPDSLTFLLDAPNQAEGGRVVIASYLMGPKSRDDLAGKRVAVLLSLDKQDARVGGGAIGTVALQDGGPVTVAWTWLGYPAKSPYAFYGTINRASVATIELTERDGTVSSVSVSGQKAFYVARPYTGGEGDGWPKQLPARLRALNASGKVLYEHVWSPRA